MCVAKVHIEWHGMPRSKVRNSWVALKQNDKDHVKVMGQRVKWMSFNTC